MDYSVDLLDRNGYVQMLKKIIDSASEEKRSSSICLYGGWGSGKSFVLNLLDKQLSDNGCLVIKYDAWDRDFYDEPLVGILYSFITQINKALQIENFFEAAAEELALAALSVFSDVISGITKKTIGIDVPDRLKKAYKRITSLKNKKNIDTSFNSNLGVEEAKDKVRKALNNLSEKKTIVLMIDEIDRCLPECSLKVLERLHHFIYGVSKVYMITAVDKQQLENVVKKYYGDSAQVDKYLQKFFDVNILLNEGNFNNQFGKRYSDYVSIFENRNLGFVSDKDIDDCIYKLFSNKNPRFVDKAVEKAFLAHDYLKSKLDASKEKAVMCIELLLAYLSNISRNRRQVFDKLLGSAICNPTSISQLTSQNVNLEELADIVSSIDSIRQLSISFVGRIHGNIAVRDIWSLIWFAIIETGRAPSTFVYSFNCNPNTGFLRLYLQDLFDYAKDFANVVFVL